MSPSAAMANSLFSALLPLQPIWVIDRSSREASPMPPIFTVGWPRPFDAASI